MNRLVSIIMPVFNAEKYLSDSIESVIRQDFPSWELIIVDDGSTDKSMSIVDSFLVRDDRIRVIHLPRNSGVATARNIGIKSAKGRYIAFLDCDDMWLPQKLSTQIEFMEKNNSVFSFTGYEWINDKGIRQGVIIKGIPYLNFNKLLRGNPIGCLTVIIDKEAIDRVEMPNVRHEDYAMWLSLTRRGYIGMGIDQNLALYRKSKKSLSANKLKTINWMWVILRKQEKLSITRALTSIFWYILSSLNKYAINTCLAKCKYRK